MESSNLGYSLVQALSVGRQPLEIGILEEKVPKSYLLPHVQTTHLNSGILGL